MNAKNLTFAIVACLLLIVSCKNNQGKKNETNEKKTEAKTDSMNPTVFGTYYGVLPCASCPGIHTYITLNEDGSFEKAMHYMGDEENPEITEGKFEWSNDKTKVTLAGNSYLIGKETITMLNSSGRETTGDLAEKYILSKTELEPELPANKGYTLQQFTDKEGKLYNVIYNTNLKIPTAVVQTDNDKKTLKQTQAWAKGAEYEGSNAKLSVTGDKATLLLNNKTIVLKNKKSE